MNKMTAIFRGCQLDHTRQSGHSTHGRCHILMFRWLLDSICEITELTILNWISVKASADGATLVRSPTKSAPTQVFTVARKYTNWLKRNSMTFQMMVPLTFQMVEVQDGYLHTCMDTYRTVQFTASGSPSVNPSTHECRDIYHKPAKPYHSHCWCTPCGTHTTVLVLTHTSILRHHVEKLTPAG